MYIGTKRLLQSHFLPLKQEFTHGIDYLTIYNEIATRIDGQEDILKEIPGLFIKTYIAHLDIAHLHLMRILDQSKHPRPVCFRTFLMKGLENLDNFRGAENHIVEENINQDLSWILPNNTKEIKELIDLRHNVFAHHGQGRITINPAKRMENVIKYETRRPAMINYLYNEVEQRIIKYQSMMGDKDPYLKSFGLGAEVERLCELLKKGLEKSTS